MLRMARKLGPVVLILVGFVAAAAQTGHQPGLPQPVPPPLPPPPKPRDAFDYEPIIEDSDRPWVLENELLAKLYERAADYAAYTRRFTCDEEARFAEYDDAAEVSREKIRRYGYLLVKGDVGLNVREYRQELAKDGSLKPGEVVDEEPFPPAYLWVFLFSRQYEPYFAFRYVADRFDGFDWVHEIQFKGSLPFSNGKDIREWEGSVLIDAVTHTPLEIRAEPSGQRDRILELYRRYQTSFNLMGYRFAPHPLGYRARIQFRHRDRDSSLTFPTELRYDTFRAVTGSRLAPVRASTRTYSKYRVFVTNDAQEFASP
jgi:hypothetical protein